MDSLTHLLVAAAMAQAGASVLSPEGCGGMARHAPTPLGRMRGAALLVVSAIAPDAEAALSFFDPALYVRLYHGPLHSILGAIALLTAFALAYQRWLSPSTALFRCLAVAAAGVGSHLGLDLFQGYGEQLFWPLTAHRYGVPLMAQFDLPVLAVLFLGMVGPALLNMVNREIGAPPVSYARPARVALALVLFLLPIRALFRARAYDTAAAALTEERESFAVFPSALAPWRWNAVEDTTIAYLLYEVDTWSGQTRPFLRLRKPRPNNFLVAAGEAGTARAFLDLASYPFYSLEEGRRGVLVRIRDLAFFSPGGSDRPFSVEVEVTSTMKILSERTVF